MTLCVKFKPETKDNVIILILPERPPGNFANDLYSSSAPIGELQLSE